VRETNEDLARLQAILNRSYENAGDHLLSVHTPDRRLTAADLADRLTGVRVLSLATTTSDGRPLTGAVDGLFYRGEFWFGSASDSVRFQHLRARPHVSATHTVGEALAVTVHGTAHEIDRDDPTNEGFRDLCLEIYGPNWEEFTAGAAYARIDAKKMFTFLLEGESG
jgi:hypothetical protein